MEVLLIPEDLLNTNEVEFIQKSCIYTKKVRNSIMKCSIYHIQEKDLEKVILSDTGNRALALRIVSKVLQIKDRDNAVKAALLACASGMGGWSPVEAERILRSV